jgi:UPF0716 protein FxsA
VIRTLFFVIFALGLLELYLLVKVGQWLGAFIPVLAVVAGFIAGGMVIRHTGLKSLVLLRGTGRDTLKQRDVAAGGLAGVLAGILFILPGLLSDVAALALLTPFARRFLAKRFNTASPGNQTIIIEGEAVEVTGEGRRIEGDTDPSPWQR